MSDTQRQPRDGETCDCGRQAVVVYTFPDADGTVREVPYCGIPDRGTTSARNARGTRADPQVNPTHRGPEVQDKIQGTTPGFYTIKLDRVSHEWEVLAAPDATREDMMELAPVIDAAKVFVGADEREAREGGK